KSDRFTGSGPTPTKFYLPAIVLLKREDATRVKLERAEAQYDPYRYIWGTGDGWFSASYGPFRRFSGGDVNQEKLSYSQPKLARHLSVFGESIALSECLEWLKSLQFKKLEKAPNGALLDCIIPFVNQPGFLPHATRLERIDSTGVYFLDGDGSQVDVRNLS